MTTADWALVISLLSFTVSIAGFIWNVWSKFIFPKAKVRVSFAVMNFLDDGNRSFISLTATNYGPGTVTLHMALTRARKGWFRRLTNGIINPLHSVATSEETTSGPFSGGLPVKIDVGESFSSYFTVKHRPLRDDPIVDVGFVDTFDRFHWAPRKKVRKVRAQIAELFPRSVPTSELAK